MHQCIDARLLRLNEERRSNTYTLALSYHVLTLLTSYIIHTYHVVSAIYSKVLCSFRMLQAMIIPSIITTMEVQLILISRDDVIVCVYIHVSLDIQAVQPSLERTANL